MLEVNNLHARVEDKVILNGLNLNVKAGEIHAIMGPNGSGKSTLSKVIAGHPAFEVTQGSISYQYHGKKIDVLSLSPEERAQRGIFMGMQYPVEIPGISNIHFLKESFNAICKAQGAPEMNEADFREFLRPKLELLEMNPSFLDRSVNTGFSGGEKKKNEILQMAVLNPQLALLDETDSGLDIDALKTVAKGVNSLHTRFNAVILVTHYQRLLDYIQPHFVHVLYKGKIIKSGTKELAKELEKRGYDSSIQEYAKAELNA
jgi:Fe-S cluster assembly ATP-binding protein